jgi:fatty acyl-CoA reductase
MNFVNYSKGHEADLVEEKSVDSSLPTIPEFYKDQEIFVTGASGFMGKVLVEKLLRSCPEIKVIYILMRPKKGKSVEERVQILKDLKLFAPLKKRSPEMLDKMVGISGDVTELGLGLSAEDLKRMENVSIIFHSAASVR